jgi:flagellar protein FlaG
MSIQSISNASASMQAMAAAPARSQTESTASVETRAENVQQNANAQEQAQRVPSAGELQKALEEVAKAVAPMAQSLQFSLDKDSGKTVVKVMDTDTNEVIRQIPSEEVLAISKAVDKLKGLLIKQEA